jgi:hypothetical protein
VIKSLLAIALLSFISVATAETHLTEDEIANIKMGAGNFLTCSVAIRSSFSLIDTIPDAKDEDGNPVEIRLHSIAEQVYQSGKKALMDVGVEESVIEDMTAGKRTQWLYLEEHMRADILEACSKALSGGK